MRQQFARRERGCSLSQIKPNPKGAMVVTEEWKAFLRTMREVHARSVKRPYAALNHVSLRISNLVEAERLLSAAFGIGPMVRFPEEYGLMPGERAIGCFWSGDVFFELVEQETPVEPARGSGLPIGVLVEVGFFVEDLEAEIARLEGAGYTVLWRGGRDGVAFAHLDTEPGSGIPIELIEVTPELEEILDA